MQANKDLVDALFVLRAPSGELKRIGRNCLADFLRTENAASALRVWDLHAKLRGEIAAIGEESYGGGGGSCMWLDTEDYLAHVAACIRVDGWTSKANSSMSRPPTYAKALRALRAGPRPTEADRTEAARVRAWGLELGAREGLGDYLHNVRVALAQGYTASKTIGLVASAVVAYRKDSELAVKIAERAAAPIGKHVGVVGERMDLELTVTRTRISAGNYGAVTILALTDDAGNELVWFASGNKEFSAGDRVVGKATIKRHSEYKGRPQTELSRCAFVTVTKIEAAS